MQAFLFNKVTGVDLQNHEKETPAQVLFDKFYGGHLRATVWLFLKNASNAKKLIKINLNPINATGYFTANILCHKCQTMRKSLRKSMFLRQQLFFLHIIYIACIMHCISYLFIWHYTALLETQIWRLINPLIGNPTKWSNTLKQFVGNLLLTRVCLTILWYWRLDG